MRVRVSGSMILALRQGFNIRPSVREEGYDCFVYGGRRKGVSTPPTAGTPVGGDDVIFYACNSE